MQWLRRQVREGMNARSYALVAVLVGVLVWIHSLDERAKALRARASAFVPATASAATLPASAGRDAAAAPTPAGWGDDPFSRRFRIEGEAGPAVRAGGSDREPRGTGLFLQGIMNGPAGRTALLNGEVVREGDRIGGREVLQIGTRSVLILDRGTVVTLTLRGDRS